MRAPIECHLVAFRANSWVPTSNLQKEQIPFSFQGSPNSVPSSPVNRASQTWLVFGISDGRDLAVWKLGPQCALGHLKIIVAVIFLDDLEDLLHGLCAAEDVRAEQ